MSPRETIFISHATPEDNEFAIWLASRLQMMGYKVWLDKNSLLGGEKFWDDIEAVIRNRAIKVLLIYSTNICQKDDEGLCISGTLKNGILKEVNLSKAIATENSIKDFVIPLNVDQAPYNLFDGADELNQIPFYENWAAGLSQLEKKLVADTVPKTYKKEDNEFLTWYETQFVNPNGIKTKKELYYSNWWSIKELPEFFYIYQFQKKEQAVAIVRQLRSFPMGKISNNLSCFNSFTEFTVNRKNENEDESEEIQIVPQETYKIKVLDVLLGFERDSFPNHRDSENHLKKLMQETFHQIMRRRGMYWYEMANKKLAYYYTPANLEKLKVKFQYPFRKNKKFKTKNLIGKHKKLGKWHFAVSAKPIIFPMLAFSLKTHIAFTTKGFKVWQLPLKDGERYTKPDTEKIHSERRAKGKRMYNEEWRDEFLAFLEALKTNDKIEIALSNEFTLNMQSFPETLWASFGYYDPKDKTRHGILATYEFDEDADETTVVSEEIIPEEI